MIQLLLFGADKIDTYTVIANIYSVSFKDSVLIKLYDDLDKSFNELSQDLYYCLKGEKLSIIEKTILVNDLIYLSELNSVDVDAEDLEEEIDALLKEILDSLIILSCLNKIFIL